MSSSKNIQFVLMICTKNKEKSTLKETLVSDGLCVQFAEHGLTEDHHSDHEHFEPYCPLPAFTHLSTPSRFI